MARITKAAQITALEQQVAALTEQLELANAMLASARDTSAELMADNATLHEQLAVANAAMQQAEAALSQAEEVMSAGERLALAKLEAHTTPSHRVQRAGYVAPAWQAERAAQMAAAKALAMRMGRTVKVEVAA